MNLPRLLVLTDAAAAGRELPSVVAEAVECGARGVVLRERAWPTARRLALAEQLRALLDPVGGLLILAGPPSAGTGPAGAVHLASRDAFPTPRPALVGRSCHSPAEVDQALREGCDYAFVSPIYPTASKPGYGPALGPAGLATLCRPGLPLYALGGVLPSHVDECLAAGAYGVAVMGPVIRDPSLVVSYLKELA